MLNVLGVRSLGIPPAPPHVVTRSRLFDALNAGVEASPLVLVAAPAGYGKSTLLASWAREANHAVAWLALEPADNDPDVLFRCLLKAWAHEQPEVLDRSVGILLGGAMPGIEPVVNAFIETVNSWDARITFVLDDYHVLVDPSIHASMATIIDHLPANVRFIVGSRETPPLPIARWRARQQLAELGPDDLRLRPNEAEVFLNSRCGLALSPDAIGELNERTEGWFAGVHLVALTIERGTEVSTLVNGRHRHIADYVREDVLNRLSPETRAFLVRTSIVDQLCASLAEAITGRGDGQAMLERLEREHLFTVPLDDNRQWFRYHRLFVDVLRAELERRPGDDVRELHLRASRWYLDNNDPDRAFAHALASADVQAAAVVFDRYGLLMLRTGQLADLRRWLEATPPDWFRAAPRLELLRVGHLLFSGQIEAGLDALAEVERSILAIDPPAHRAQARLTAVKCFVACITNDIDRALSFADSALAALTPADEDFRADVFGALGDTFRRLGRWNDAREHYRNMLRHTGSLAGQVQALHAWGALADLELRRGRLRYAADYWRRALDRFESPELWGGYELPAVGWVHIRLGEILYEWNDLEAARVACDRGRERAELGGDPRAIIASGLLATRLLLARGEPEAADAQLAAVRDVVADAQFPDWRAEMERCQVEAWLAQDRLRAAVLWADEARARETDALPDQESVTLAVARVLVRSGDLQSGDQALRILAPVIATAEAEGRDGLRIAALGLRALVLAGRGDTAGALATIQPALQLAEPDGYARTFLDLGQPMARLLQEVAARNVMREYVGCLLAGFDEVCGAPGRSAPQLSERLSQRELEVLRSIAAGLTNREIADALYISSETVKKHASSIYGKLGVGGRTQAIARARELELLD